MTNSEGCLGGLLNRRRVLFLCRLVPAVSFSLQRLPRAARRARCATGVSSIRLRISATLASSAACKSDCVILLSLR